LEKLIRTAYGEVNLEVRELNGSRILVTQESFDFLAGTKSRGGSLKERLAAPRGTVLIPSWYDFGGRGEERLHHIVPAGIYEALRRATHTLRKYGLKKTPGELQNLRAISDRLSRDLAVLMEGKSASSRDLVEVRYDLTRIAQALGGSRNKLKLEAAKKIAAAATLKVEHPSGTKSQNLPATTLRVHAAKRRVDGRHINIRRIGPRVIFLEQVLAQTVGGIFDDLGSLRNTLRAERFQISLSFSSKVRHIFASRVNFALERLLPQLDVAPFRKTAALIRLDLAKAKSAKSKKFALAAIDRILAAIRLKEAQRAFESRVILPLALAEAMDIVTEADFRHTLIRLSDFSRWFHQEINDSGFIRPVKERVLAAIRGTTQEEFGPVEDPDATRLKERLKAISGML
jgi:hypothetical protein